MSSLAERYAKMEPREQKLLQGLGIALLAIVFFVIPFYLHQMVSDRRDENQAIRDTIDRIAEQRAKIEKRMATQNQLLTRYQKSMPPLASFVEDAAKGNLEIEETQARPDVPHGKKYVEHVIGVKFRKVGMLGLAKMMEKIERSGLPVAITRLNLKPRVGEADSYDVEMHVSAFEQKDLPKKNTKTEQPEEEEEP